MESRMTIVQALDERDLLVKKILDRTQKAQLVDLVRQRAAVTLEKHLTRGEFEAQARGALQQLEDLIARYDRLNFAISVSNAETMLETSRGRMTVACAIALRSRLRGDGVYGELADFEGRLAQKMEEQYRDTLDRMRRKNEAMRRTALPRPQNNRGRNGAQVIVLQAGDPAARRSANPETGTKKSKGTMDAVLAKQPDAFHLFDPLHLRQKAEAIWEEREQLLIELDTKIRISNANTLITV